MMTLERIITVGVYGFTPASFFAALQQARVDFFCDVRRRRSVRGSEYAFANSQRLQSRLAGLGIAYLHFPELAPSEQLRRAQFASDQLSGIPKRQRVRLCPEFIAGYNDECLREFRTGEFVSQLSAGTRILALFCVEGEPGACHRSLLAERLQLDLDVEVCHLIPT